MLATLDGARGVLHFRYSGGSAEENDVPALILYLVQYSCICALFLLNMRADEKPSILDKKVQRQENPSPKITASFASKLSFVWMESLIWKGYKNPLEVKDLWELSPDISLDEVVSRFEYYYRYVLALLHEVFSPFNGMNSSFLQRQSIKRSKESGKPHSVLPSLIKCFGPVLVASAIFRVVCDTLMMVTPQIMKRMISHVTLVEIGAEGVYPWQGEVLHEKELFRIISNFPTIPFPRLLLCSSDVHRALRKNNPGGAVLRY